VPSNAKQVLDDPVYREESLGLLRRLEPAHLPLSLSRWLMRDFGPVVRDELDQGVYSLWSGSHGFLAVTGNGEH